MQTTSRKTTGERLPSSFRDPSGFVFTRGGRLYRQVNRFYKPHYERMLKSGLYQALMEDRLLIAHQERDDLPAPEPETAYKILAPQQIETVSYPYEWCFSQLKDAALITLEIQRRSLDFGMSLKDATPFNIQFRGVKPVFIDTLSFEIYEPGKPWVAYRQFCEHFLAPLALMAYRDVCLARLLQIYINGLPLQLTGKLLPLRTRLRLGLLTHLHMHARAQSRYQDRPTLTRSGERFGLQSFRGLVDSLESTVQKLHWKPGKTEWSDYYGQTNYSSAAAAHKAGIVEEYLERIRPGRLWDLGANDGRFSRLAAARGIGTVALDVDAAAVEKNYQRCRREGTTHLLPLVMDVTNPSPAGGWDHQERDSLAGRGPVDAVMALALLHHLAISNNLPLDKIARWLSRLGRWAIIEFVPKNDSQVQRLLASRKDIFSEYTQDGFENSFQPEFSIEDSKQIPESERTLYLMRSRRP